jgi:hypothetical protein
MKRTRRDDRIDSSHIRGSYRSDDLSDAIGLQALERETGSALICRRPTDGGSAAAARCSD